MDINGVVKRLQMIGYAARHPRGNRGRCPICQTRTLFVEAGATMRDSYLCVRCRSLPRMRALVTALDAHAQDWRDRRVLEPSSWGPASAAIRAQAAEYVPTQFFPGVTPGTFFNGHRVEDLERLTFPDQSFDLVVTQDVFEHVLNPDRAFREIARVLRPGGAHVFTVPIWQHEKTVVRVRQEADGTVRDLLPRMWHGDPVSDGALVVTDWAPDIVDFIREASGLPSHIWVRSDRSIGLDGEHLEVVVTRKPLVTSGATPSSAPSPHR